MAKSSQKFTFEPSPIQIQFIEYYLDYDKKHTLEEIGKKIGVTRQSIWKWFQQEDFVNWINSKKNEMLNSSLSDRYKVAIRKAKAGDFQFSKLLFEMQGEYVQKSEHKNINIDTDFEELSDQEMIEEFGRDLNRYKATANRQRRTKKKVKTAQKEKC